MGGYKHYIRIDLNNVVIHCYSSAFLKEVGGNEEIMLGDICVNEDGERHYNPQPTDVQGQFGYQWENGQMVDITQDADFLLQEAKRQKITELSAACINALLTFSSSALATPHTYLSGMNDMILLNGEYAFLKGDDYDGQPVIWYTIESGNVAHTKAQFIQVYLDGRAHIGGAKYRLASLEPQVSTATTVDQINAITW